MGTCVSQREHDEIIEENKKLKNENKRLNSQIINSIYKITPIDFYDIIIHINSINDIIKGWKVE